jgi:EAL domain-containing protein (putative c-di-GMP-specific phosphodiesterase class I)
MSHPALDEYIARLPRVPMPGHRIWLNAAHQAQGRYFNCTLTSVFQPLRMPASGRVLAHEAFIRSAADGQPGLSVWRLLEGAASDEESIELDRLCRMLHAVNFFRQPGAHAADLYLSVHERLLAAVSNNHGMVFRRVLESLGLPLRRIVLQLPQARSSHRFLLQYVADNYQRSGFRVALNVADAAEGLRLMQLMRPDAIKVDARALADPAAAHELAQACASRGVGLVFKRIETQTVADAVTGMHEPALPVLLQGCLWDQPQPWLHAQAARAGADAPVSRAENLSRCAAIRIHSAR